MQWSWSESVLSNRERVMEELIHGRELVSQLSTAFDNRSLVNGDDGGSAEGTVNEILGSVVNTLLIMNGKESDQEFVSDQIQGNSSGVSGSDVSDAAIKSEDYTEGEIKINCKSTSTFKDRRGYYKGRDYFKTSELVLDCTSPRDSSEFISFDSANCLNNKPEHPVGATSDHTVTSHDNHWQPSDDLVSHDDLMAFESSGSISRFSSSIDQYDGDDVFSRMIAEYFDMYNEVR
ncbi:WRKY transcription factor 70 [Pyrus ussuriensis x Pyrus communis]|uniref:WRKY transcription factor 70 n=1 Tax=Pyrus ussuriensis x Pyrus communis TaxID=2448454 RepID=A0A5N5HUI7_9ROSA|nr:WRKY transcription factor 70 [Pyrus ussuriensis x Pyrus communis]